MQPFTMNRETRSKLYLSTLRILREAGTPEEQAEAYATTISMCDTPDIVLALATALSDSYLWPFERRGEYVNLDVRELQDEHGTMTTRCALILAGCRQRQDGRFTTAPVGSGANARTLSVPPDLLEHH